MTTTKPFAVEITISDQQGSLLSLPDEILMLIVDYLLTAPPYGARSEQSHRLLRPLICSCRKLYELGSRRQWECIVVEDTVTDSQLTKMLSKNCVEQLKYLQVNVPLKWGCPGFLPALPCLKGMQIDLPLENTGYESPPFDLGIQEQLTTLSLRGPGHQGSPPSLKYLFTYSIYFGTPIHNLLAVNTDKLLYMYIGGCSYYKPQAHEVVLPKLKYFGVVILEDYDFKELKYSASAETIKLRQCDIMESDHNPAEVHYLQSVPFLLSGPAPPFRSYDGND